MNKTKTIDWPFIIILNNEEKKPLAGIPVWIGPRFANTDLNGEALFLGLEPGDYELSIDAADFRPLRKKIKIHRKVKNLEFILQGFMTGGIKGNVHLSGSVFPLPDTEIKITAIQPEETGAETFGFWTDWDGNYSSGYIPVGEYEYHVDAPLCQPKQGRIKIEKDTVLTLDLDIEPVPDPAKITVVVKTDDGDPVKKCKVRLLEGMGTVTAAEKEGAGTLVFTGIDCAPFNRLHSKERPFIGRNFVVAADIEGYHTGYAAGSLRSGKECETVVLCRKINTGDLVIAGSEASQPAVVPLDEPVKVQNSLKEKESLFKILLPHPGQVNVKAGPNPYNTVLRILDKDLNLLAESMNYAGNPVEKTIRYGSGELLIGIRGICDVPEAFTALTVNYQPVIDPYQPNNTFDTALPVEFGEIIRPFIFPQGDVKYFMVAVKRPGILRARLTNCEIRAGIRILDPQAQEMVCTLSYPNQPSDASCIVYEPGLYRVQLLGIDPGVYTLSPAQLSIDFIGTNGCAREFAPGTATPKPVPIGKRFGGILFPRGKYCLYRFSLDRTGFIKIRFRLSGCNLQLRVLTGKGKKMYSEASFADCSLNPDIAIHEAGDYFIEVTGRVPSEQHLGNFFIGVFFYPDDEYEGYNGNDSPATAAEIHIGQEVTATIGRPGDIDFYRFYVDQPGLLVQNTRTFPLKVGFIVDDPRGKVIFSDCNYAGSKFDREYLVLHRGYHTLKVLGVFPHDYSPVSYGFRLEINRVKPESAQPKNKPVLNLNSGIKLDALIPGGIKSLTLPVTAPGTITIGAKIHIKASLIITGPDGKELFNIWNYVGYPMQSTIKPDAPTTLQITVRGMNPADWSKECCFIYAADGDIPPEPALTLERIFEDNRKVLFNVSGAPADKHTIAKYEMDFEGNGKYKQVGPGPVEHKYSKGQLYTPRLRVTDDRGAVGTESMFLDLIDVTLSGMSCRVVFPRSGEIVTAPGSVLAQASSGPGKPVKGMKLFLDGCLLAGNDLTHIEAELDWKSLAPGEHTIKATAYSADDRETQDTATFKMSDVFDLWPGDGKVITGSRAIITWSGPIPAATRVEYRKTGEKKWEKAGGREGKKHRVILEGLEPGIPYEFRAGDGNTRSETRSFTLQKGLSFERPGYGVTIPREYGQTLPVTVRNNSGHPLEVVLECRPPEDNELLVGFVGEGSEDRPVPLPPGEVRQYLLSLSAQDCIHEWHRFPVQIRSKDGFSDQAEVEVRVKIPKVDLRWEELETNPNTLGKKLRLVNQGDGMTDLTVRTVPENAFRLRPAVEHALLQANASLELWVEPVLHDSFKNITGEVKIETFGKTFSHKLECAVPEGMQVYKVTVDPTWWDIIKAWFCTNRPRIEMILSIPAYLEKNVLGEKIDSAGNLAGLAQWLLDLQAAYQQTVDFRKLILEILKSLQLNDTSPFGLAFSGIWIAVGLGDWVKQVTQEAQGDGATATAAPGQVNVPLIGRLGRGVEKNNPQDVLAVQRRLRSLGFTWIEENGSMDDETLKAIALFQSIISTEGEPFQCSIDDCSCQGKCKESKNVTGVIAPGDMTHRWLQSPDAPHWIKMPTGDPRIGYIVDDDDAESQSWGTDWMRDVLHQTASSYILEYYTPAMIDYYRSKLLGQQGKLIIPAPLSVNDISLEQGGFNADHTRHQAGRECDLRLPRTDGGNGGICYYSSANKKEYNPNYNIEATRAMLRLLMNNPSVRKITFNDRALLKKLSDEYPLLKGKLTSDKNENSTIHDNHIHIAISPPHQINGQ